MSSSESSLSSAGINAAVVLDSLPEAVIFLDSRKRIRQANSTCRAFFPGAQNFLGRVLISVVMDHRIDRLVTLAAESKETQRELIEGPTSQLEQQLWWELDAAPMQVEKETWIRLIIRDETERHQLEQIRRDFVANASHELRTPLTILRGNLENLLDGGLEQPQLAKRFVSTALKHTERLGRLVEDMLALSRIEYQGDVPANRENFSLCKITEEVFERLESVRLEQQASLELRIPEDFGTCLGDAFYWEQILYNLVENSLKNNREQTDLCVQVNAGREQDIWWLEVTDNGVGIPRADLPYIFKRFYRVQKDHGPALRGTGLGLSIVRRAVKAHRGEIFVTSSPGIKTCFRVEIPFDLNTSVSAKVLDLSEQD